MADETTTGNSLRAAVFSVGNEVVHGFIVDSNSAWLARELGDLGFEVLYHASIGDDEAEIARRLGAALKEGLLAVVTGGIGPTQDDRTRQAAASALSAPLRLDHDCLASLKERYSAVGREFPAGSEVQCMLPRNAELVSNAFGTAACFFAAAEEGGGAIACLPGVPREMKGVWREELRARIVERYGLGRRYFSREIRVFGTPESDLDNRLPGLLATDNVEAAILVDDAEIRLRWRTLAEDAAEAEELFAPIVEKAMGELGDLVYADGPLTLQQATVELLLERKLTVAVAESCTGGMIAQMLTSVPGSSGVLIEGAVTYSNKAKGKRLKVKTATLDKHGAVSEEVALEMALGMLKTAGADIAVATTGIAGPGGGTDEKPVGTVWIGAAMGMEAKAWHLNVPGDRELVRQRAARAATNVLRLAARDGALPVAICQWITPPD